MMARGCVNAAQEKYKFKAHVFHAAGFANREEYRAAHGSDLYLTDIEAYDRICKASTLTAKLNNDTLSALQPHTLLRKLAPSRARQTPSGTDDATSACRT